MASKIDIETQTGARDQLEACESSKLMLWLPDGKESKSWLAKAACFGAVKPIEFPSELSKDSQQLEKYCKIVREFAEACVVSLALVHKIDRQLYVLALLVVRQYYIIVCLRFEQWARKRLGPHQKAGLYDLQRTLKRLQGALEKEWSPAELDVSQTLEVAAKWLHLTIFHIAFAALASTFDPTTVHATAEPKRAFELHARSGIGVEWLEATEGLRPSTVLINLTDRAVGVSVPRWRLPGKRHGPSFLEIWEKEVRREGMPHRARTALGQARSALEQVCDALLPWEQAYARGLAALQDQVLGQCHVQDSPAAVFAACCQGKQWMTMSGESLRQVDQCPACRLKYVGVQPVPPNEPVAVGTTLDKNWDRKFPHIDQCAEDDMLSRLIVAADLHGPPDVVLMSVEPTLPASWSAPCAMTSRC